MAGRDFKELFRAFRNADELAFRRAANTIFEEEEERHHVALAKEVPEWNRLERQSNGGVG